MALDKMEKYFWLPLIGAAAIATIIRIATLSPTDHRKDAVPKLEKIITLKESVLNAKLDSARTAGMKEIRDSLMKAPSSMRNRQARISNPNDYTLTPRRTPL